MNRVVHFVEGDDQLSACGMVARTADASTGWPLVSCRSCLQSRPGHEPPLPRPVRDAGWVEWGHATFLVSEVIGVEVTEAASRGGVPRRESWMVRAMLRGGAVVRSLRTTSEDEAVDVMWDLVEVVRRVVDDEDDEL